MKQFLRSFGFPAFISALMLGYVAYKERASILGAASIVNGMVSPAVTNVGLRDLTYWPGGYHPIFRREVRAGVLFYVTFDKIDCTKPQHTPTLYWYQGRDAVLVEFGDDPPDQKDLDSRAKGLVNAGPWVLIGIGSVDDIVGTRAHVVHKGCGWFGIDKQTHFYGSVW
jgi:hypothetical protein